MRMGPLLLPVCCWVSCERLPSGDGQDQLLAEQPMLQLGHYERIVWGGLRR